jgi:hypothetical protein
MRTSADMAGPGLRKIGRTRTQPIILVLFRCLGWWMLAAPIGLVPGLPRWSPDCRLGSGKSSLHGDEPRGGGQRFFPDDF